MGKIELLELTDESKGKEEVVLHDEHLATLKPMNLVLRVSLVKHSSNPLHHRILVVRPHINSFVGL